jgi:hypothetical protein
LDGTELLSEKLHGTLFKKPSVTQEHDMWALENSVIQIGRAAQSMWMTEFSDGGIFLHPHVVLLRQACLYSDSLISWE